MKSYIQILIAVATVVAIGFLFVAVRDAREVARANGCRGRICQLTLALDNYHSVHGSFPPAWTPGPDGTPWHSWRVLLLPQMEETELYEKYRFDEPWNGPNNSKLAKDISLVGNPFRCPSSGYKEDDPFTDYVVIVGKETVFPGSKVVSREDISDEPENTLLIVEIANSGIHWMEPRDLDFKCFDLASKNQTTAGISSHHPAGPAVGFANQCNSFRLAPSVQLKTLRALATACGGEDVSKQDLLAADPRTLRESRSSTAQ